MMVLIGVVATALLLDKLLGEPARYHPLVIFGAYVDALEAKLNVGNNKRINGVVAVACALIPLTLLAVLLARYCADNVVLTWLVSSVVLYIAIGWQSLIDHASRITEPLELNDIQQARQAVSFIVSRDTSQLSEQAVAKAAVESVLENGADAVFAPIFWFCVLGVPGVVFYRLSNTLDAMWGYKNTRFLEFGWCAAKLDDVMNLIPARLTAFSYALMGDTVKSITSWRQQGHMWDSPNAGPVMAAGAGALNVELGGGAMYGEQLHQRITLGVAITDGGQVADACAIRSACKLLNNSVGLWLAALIILAAFLETV